MPILLVPSGLKKSINLCNINTLLDQIHNIMLDKIHQSKIELYENEKYLLIDLVKKIALTNNKKIIINLVTFLQILSYHKYCMAVEQILF